MFRKRSITARRLTAFCLVFLVLCSTLTACTPNEESSVPEKEDTKQTQLNKPTENDGATTPSDNATTPSDEGTKPTEPEQTLPSTENTTPTEPEGTQPPTDATEPAKPVIELDVRAGTDFSDGVAFIVYKDMNNQYVYAAIDTAGKILFEPDFLDSLNRTPTYKNGIFIWENCIYDKTGTILASPELSGYDELISENCDGYVLAKKTVESFSGDKIQVGVLDKKGSWLHPLSDTNPVAIALMDDAYASVGSYSGDYIIHITGQKYYNIVTNELTDGHAYYESRHYQGQPRGIYKCETNGESTLIIPDVYGHIFFDTAFIGNAVIYDDDGYEIETPYMLYDYNGNVIADLSQYNIVDNSNDYGPGMYYLNNHLLVTVDNGTGAKYLCLINKAGELAFEPIRMQYYDDYFPLEEHGFVYYDDARNKYCHYDYSGTVTEYTNIEGFWGFSCGLALVRTTNDEYCYINVRGEVVIN